MIKYRVEGMKELQKSLKKLGDVPQKHVTSSARKGMNIVLSEAKADAPVDTGALKKGIILVGERSKTKGKKVYKAIFDPKMNDVFQKPIQKPGSRGGRGKNPAYYPASQEYGFFAGHGNYIPGFRFLHKALDSKKDQMAKTIVSEMKKKIDAEIAKAGLR